MALISLFVLAVQVGIFFTYHGLWATSELDNYKVQVKQLNQTFQERHSQWQIGKKSLLDKYNVDVILSQTPNVTIGLQGFTVAPGGGGPGDRLVRDPVQRINFTRTPGTNFAFGPVGKLTRVHSVRFAAPYMAAFSRVLQVSTVNVNITAPKQNQSLTIGRFTIPNATLLIDIDLPTLNITDFQLQQGESGSIDVVSDTSTVLFINSDSFVWLSMSEAAISKPSFPMIPDEPTRQNTGLQDPPVPATDISQFVNKKLDVLIPLFPTTVLTVVGIVIGIKFSTTKENDEPAKPKVQAPEQENLRGTKP